MAQWVNCAWDGFNWVPSLNTITATNWVMLDATIPGAVIDASHPLPECYSLEVMGGPIGIGVNVTTSGPQLYQTAVTLTGNVSLNANEFAMTFYSTVDGNSYNLTIDNGYGLVEFKGNISNFNSLEVNGYTNFIGTVSVTNQLYVSCNATFGGTVTSQSLVVDGTANIYGGIISTNDFQWYNGHVMLGANTTLTTNSGDVRFGGLVSGSYSLTLTPGSLRTYVGGNITTTGSQSYNGTVIPTNSIVLSATGATATITMMNIEFDVVPSITITAGGGISITSFTSLPERHRYWTNTTTSNPGGAGTPYYPGSSNLPFTDDGTFKFIKIEVLYYGIALDKTGTEIFTAATYCYPAQTPLNVTVTNIGEYGTGTLNVQLSGANAGSFTLSSPTIPSIDFPGDSETFTVVPNTGLAAGTYTATVTVSNANVPAETFDVSFTVNKANTTTTTTTMGSSTYGQPILLTATVTPDPLSSCTPTGTVTFYMNIPFSLPFFLEPITGFFPAQLPTVALDGSGVFSGSFNLSSILSDIVGSYLAGLIGAVIGNSVHFYATYNGDSNFNTSTSPPANHVIGKQTPTFTEPVSFTATYGETLADLETQFALASDDTPPIPGTFAWEQATTSSMGTVAASPNTTYTLEFTPNNTEIYEVVSGITTMIAVSPIEVTITGITATKIYDGTNSFTNAQIDVTAATIVGKLAADNVSVSKTGVAGTYGPNVGTGTLTVTSGSFALAGADAGNYSLSAQPTVEASITKANTNTVVTTDGTTYYGQPINISATVTAVPPGAGTPTGTVTFYFKVPFALPAPLNSLISFPLAVATVPLNGSGVATMPIDLSSVVSPFVGASLTDFFVAIIGNNVVFYAEYNGDGNFNTSTSAPANHIINKAIPTFDEPILFSATYGEVLTVLNVQFPAGSNDTPSVSGTFSWEVANPAITLVGKVANSPIGIFTLKFTPWNTGLYEIISGITTSITVAKKPITFAGTVKATKEFDCTPDFFNPQITIINAGKFNTLVSMDKVSLDKVGVSGGTFGPDAGTGILDYAGGFALMGADANNYLLATQPVVIAEIFRAATVTTLTSEPNPSLYGQEVTFTATVTVVTPCGEPLTGVVEFREGTTGTGTLVEDGVATFTTRVLSADEHFVTAHYLGSSNFAPSLSPVLMHDVICPANFDDHEGNLVTITRLAGLCWTSNMKNKTYTDEEPIPFARAYQDNDAYAAIFGLLYDWNSATRELNAPYTQGVCPEGWHIPTQAEFMKLGRYSDTQLKSVNHWVNATGTDDFGFTALPAGNYNNAITKFVDLFGTTGYWTCGLAQDNKAYSFLMNYYCKYIQESSTAVTDALSVRCVMDLE